MSDPTPAVLGDMCGDLAVDLNRAVDAYLNKHVEFLGAFQQDLVLRAYIAALVVRIDMLAPPERMPTLLRVIGEIALQAPQLRAWAEEAEARERGAP